jgi:hypothetical protein
LRQAGDGVITHAQERDYLIAADDLVLGGAATLPERGDQIDETIDGATVTFEVLPLAGEAHWRYSDPFRTLLRVHTRQN